MKILNSNFESFSHQGKIYKVELKSDNIYKSPKEFFVVSVLIDHDFKNGGIFTYNSDTFVQQPNLDIKTKISNAWLFFKSNLESQQSQNTKD